MAKSPTEDTPKKKRGTTILGWILLAMLIGGLGSFGATSFGGGESNIGSVGARKISASEYARALRQQINAFSQQIGTTLTLQQAQSFGLDQQVMQGVITQASLDDEAAKVGLSVGDDAVKGQLRETKAFHGLDGSFDLETYKQMLSQNNLLPTAYEAELRRNIARDVLQSAVTAGFAAPQSMTDTLYKWAGEQRGFTLLRQTEATLPAPIAAPTDADLKTYYDANIAAFTRPEAKRITYASLLPDTLAQTMPADEAALKALYQERIAEFVIPEKRLVERLAFASDDEAKAAKARLDAGEPFETLVKERELSLADLDLGDVSKADLTDAGEAVFGLTEPGVVGPFASPIGPALFRMNAILAAQETSFDQARPALLVEMQTEAARKAIGDRVEAIDDLLAGGASIEDIAKDEKMTIGVTDYAPGADDNDAISGYADFAKAADALQAGDFPEAILLDDGGVVAIRFEAVVPPAPVPLDKVRDKVVASWQADALAKALASQATEFKAAIAAGTVIDTLGAVERTPLIDRQGVVKDAPPSVIAALFEMAVGEVRAVTEPGFSGLVMLDSITPAANDGEEAAALRDAIIQQSQKGMAADALSLYSKSLGEKAGIQIDQAVINAVHAQFGN